MLPARGGSGGGGGCPALVVIDARNVERRDATTQQLGRPAWEREREGGEAEQLRQTAQLRACYEQLRRRFARSRVDVFVNERHYLDVSDDEHIRAIRDADPEAFQKVPGGQDVDRMVLSHASAAAAGGGGGDGGVVVVSNDRFRDHIASGTVSEAWVRKHVWGFMFVRGALVISQPETDGPISGGNFSGTPALGGRGTGGSRGRLMRHMRSNGSAEATQLRQGPEASAAPSPEVTAQDSEEVEVLSELSEISGRSGGEGGEGCYDGKNVITWARVRCSAGQGWLDASHLIPLLAVGQRLRHERLDNPPVATTLRPLPDPYALPAADCMVQPREDVTALGEEGAWVRIRCMAGEGWLKRVHLTAVQEQGRTGADGGGGGLGGCCPPRAKRPRGDGGEPPQRPCEDETRRFHVKNLGHGKSSLGLLEDLYLLLKAHGVAVPAVEVGERPAPRPPCEGELARTSLQGTEVDKGDDVASADSGAVLPISAAAVAAVARPLTMGPPPLARWYLRFVDLHGSEEVLDALGGGVLKIRIEGLTLEFSAPLDRDRRRRRPPKTYDFPSRELGLATPRPGGQAAAASIVSSQAPTPPRNGDALVPCSQAPALGACSLAAGSRRQAGGDVHDLPCSQAPRREGNWRFGEIPSSQAV